MMHFCLLCSKVNQPYTYTCCVLICSNMSDSFWPMDCSPPGFSIHGIFQARILEWVAISYSDTYIQPLFFVFPSSLVTTEHWVGFPVLYSRFSLVIHFISMSMSISQFIPPIHFPPWCPYICSLCLCLYFWFANKFICTIFLDSTYMC